MERARPKVKIEALGLVFLVGVGSHRFGLVLDDFVLQIKDRLLEILSVFFSFLLVQQEHKCMNDERISNEISAENSSTKRMFPACAHPSDVPTLKMLNPQ